MADVLNKLGQAILPKVFAKLRAAGLNDKMDVIAFTPTSDGAGGQQIAESVAYSDVPVSDIRKETRRRDIQGGKTISIQEFTLTFPTHDTDGDRYDITPANRLKVLENPKKSFG